MNQNHLSPILKNGIRILRPCEFTALTDNIQKKDYKTLVKALLFTGMRYKEMQRFQKHPSWFDGTFINLPKEAVHKHKRTQMERSVKLNPLGRMAIEYFLQVETKLPSYQSWSANLGCWANRAGFQEAEKRKKKYKGVVKVGFHCPGLSSKFTRKTWESWLMFFYPNRSMEVALSQGHTTVTSLQHYLNLSFTERDRLDMKEYVAGW